METVSVQSGRDTIDTADTSPNPTPHLQTRIFFGNKSEASDTQLSKSLPLTHD